MDDKTTQSDGIEEQTLDLLEKIQRGKLDPKALSLSQRQPLVDFLANEDAPAKSLLRRRC